MTNELGRFPEVCKKSMQAMAADMRGQIEPRFFETYSLDQLRSFTSRELELCGRLVQPVVARPGDSHYRPASWNDAFDLVAEALKGTLPERAFFYASGRSSNEAGFLMHLFARAYGTNHVNNCSFYCHQASGVGLRESIGTPTATIELDDLEKCDLVFVIGGNPASNHPRFMTTLMNVRRRGGKVIVINPLREVGLLNFRVPSNVASMLFGSEIASRYVQPSIGGDIALLAGIAKTILEQGSEASAFIESATEGFDAFLGLVRALTWTEVESQSGVPRAEIKAIAADYAASERSVFAWTMGITHHEHGVENVQWIVNLALLRGMVGKKGAGLLPIRGHSNVQGIGTMGVSPMIREAAAQRMELLGIRPPTFKGHDTMSAMEAAGRGEMSFGLSLGGNLYGANPDSSFASNALGQLVTLVYLSTALNTGHAHGLGKTTLILPVLARDEETQSTTQESMFNYVRLSDGGQTRLTGPKSEVEILAEIARRVLPDGPVSFAELSEHDRVRELIGQLVPTMKEVSTIGLTKREFHIPGRLLHEPNFATASGKARFQPHTLPTLASLQPNQLRLMTIRSEGQFNTVVYDEEDIYRGQVRRDVILMNPDDIERMGLSIDQAVNVQSASGQMAVLVRPVDIAQGCAAMYYPEANVLVARGVDPRSKTPAFKSTVVAIEPGATAINGHVARSAVAASSRGRMKAC